MKPRLSALRARLSALRARVARLARRSARRSDDVSGGPARRRRSRSTAGRRVLRVLGALLVFGVLLGAVALWRLSLRRTPALASLPSVLMPVDLDALSDAITELDVTRARQLAEQYQRSSLSVTQSHRLAIERARLSLYVGDCDSARAILSALPGEEADVASLAALAENCAGAVAASRVVEDPERGIWLRLQDADDEPLVPYIVDVADRAREAVRVDLGVELPRPLRIDVVRDLFSLSCVSGLPLEAAETTGTVAVARWGRVTLLSPRASRHGYPWQDTLAHELVHLSLSRATRDFAPLWLQEGVAKRQEQRWRAPRPFDDPDGHDRVAQRALLTNTSVGVDNLGPSIAMLPSADAASIAFSEVTSFINYWIRVNGKLAFHLLLHDLKGLEQRDPDPALRGVSGYTLKEWIVRWQTWLRALSPEDDPHATIAASSPELGRVRVGDLFLHGQHYDAAARNFEAALAHAPQSSALRFRSSQAQLAAGRKQLAEQRLGKLKELDGPHAGWFALRARFDAEAGDSEAARAASTMALSLDPWSELVACEGHQSNLLGADPWQLPDPGDPDRRKLCEMARARPPVQ
ncbi:MAG TPA: tetratricopeptide repeat protein [Polyangiaceae bacterium]|nr:tetratricopeptide repeat protein [Polyangiaceae bacterium]